MPDIERSQDDLFDEALATYGDAIERLARAYEADGEARRDLLQEIHIALWKSFGGFNNRCSLRTWIYRVAHNTAASHVGQQLRRKKLALVGLEKLVDSPDRLEGAANAD